MSDSMTESTSAVETKDYPAGVSIAALTVPKRIETSNAFVLRLSNNEFSNRPCQRTVQYSVRIR